MSRFSDCWSNRLSLNKMKAIFMQQADAKILSTFENCYWMHTVKKIQTFLYFLSLVNLKTRFLINCLLVFREIGECLWINMAEKFLIVFLSFGALVRFGTRKLCQWYWWLIWGHTFSVKLCYNFACAWGMLLNLNTNFFHFFSDFSSVFRLTQKNVSGIYIHLRFSFYCLKKTQKVGKKFPHWRTVSLWMSFIHIWDGSLYIYYRKVPNLLLTIWKLDQKLGSSIRISFKVFIS